MRVRISLRALCPRNLMDQKHSLRNCGWGFESLRGRNAGDLREKAALIRLSARDHSPPPARRAQGQTVSRLHDTQKKPGSTPGARTTRGWSSGWASVLHADEAGSIPAPRTEETRMSVLRDDLLHRWALKAPGVRLSPLPPLAEWSNGKTAICKIASSGSTPDSASIAPKVLVATRRLAMA